MVDPVMTNDRDNYCLDDFPKTLTLHWAGLKDIVALNGAGIIYHFAMYHNNSLPQYQALKVRILILYQSIGGIIVI